MICTWNCKQQARWGGGCEILQLPRFAINRYSSTYWLLPAFQFNARGPTPSTHRLVISAWSSEAQFNLLCAFSTLWLHWTGLVRPANPTELKLFMARLTLVLCGLIITLVICFGTSSLLISRTKLLGCISDGLLEWMNEWMNADRYIVDSSVINFVM